MPASKNTLGPLVSAEWLQKHLRDKKLRLLDVRWYLQGKDGREEYAKGHIPGAVFVDLEGDITARVGPGRHPVPGPEQLSEAMQAAGVSNDSIVVAYDDLGGSIAARVWFLFELYGHAGQVHVLDGGLPAWNAIGGELSTDIVEPRRGDFVSGPMRRSLLDKHQVERLRSRRGMVLLDARAPERYRGDVEPVDARPGHIPGAKNAPWPTNLEDGRFKDRASLRKQYASLIGNGEAILYCGSGVTACHDLLALEVAGFPAKRTHLYEGSWSDWAKDSFRPAEVGEPPRRGQRKA